MEVLAFVKSTDISTIVTGKKVEHMGTDVGKWVDVEHELMEISLLIASIFSLKE